ncbi:MAG: GNAT family N-acetyltransferase [Planctomycetota bacterium]
MQQEQSIDLQIVDGSQGVADFGDDWDDLFARAVHAPPYLSRAWARTFIEEERLPGTPLFILARSGAKLVAMLPLAIRRVLGARVAVPIGTGEGAYLGLLLDPDYPAVTEHMAELITSRKVFDVYYSDDLSSEDEATAGLLDNLAKRGYCCRRVFRRPCLYIRLGCSFDEYLNKQIPKGRRRYKLRYRERKLYKSGGVKVTRYVGGDITPEVNGRVAAIQLESWMKSRGAAVLGQPFYQRLLANMAEGGFGHVWLMTINGEDAAFVYSFVAHRQHHYFWPAFKLKYESSLSVGQILLMQVIRDCCADGVVHFDFIHGDAEYKRFWATDSYTVYRVVAGRGFTGRLIAAFYYFVLRLVRIKWVRSSLRRIRTSWRRLRQ